jgi:hypothetical protein
MQAILDFLAIPDIPIPWLEEDPTMGDILADDITEVDVTFTALPTLTLGTYTATLLVETGDDMYPEATIPVTLNIVECVPVSGADFGWWPAVPVVGEMVTFSGTVAAGDEPIEYLWSMDGTPLGAGQEMTHTMETAGDHTMVMTATNCGGAYQSVIEHTMTVEEAPDEYYHIYLPIVFNSYD